MEWPEPTRAKEMPRTIDGNHRCEWVGRERLRGRRGRDNRRCSSISARAGVYR